MIHKSFSFILSYTERRIKPPLIQFTHGTKERMESKQINSQVNSVSSINKLNQVYIYVNY